MRKAAIIVLLLMTTASAVAIESSLIDVENRKTDMHFDRVNSSNVSGNFTNPLGSFSYRDNSIVNPNALLDVCDLQSSDIGSRIQLFYSSESGNITIPLLSKPAQISSINATGCTKIDIDISSYNSTFPALPTAGLLEKVNKTSNVTQGNNTTLVNRSVFELTDTDQLNQSFNGSYEIGVVVNSPQNTVKLSISQITDQNGTNIHENRVFDRDRLIMSLVTNNNTVFDERLLGKSDKESFNFRFQGGEQVYINGLLSLETKTVGGCRTINESGFYYILNDSVFNVGDSCLKLENIEKTVFDFANQTVDGDNSPTGSKRPDTCGITIENSSQVTIKAARVQEWDKAICIENSRDIQVIDRAATFNNDGIDISNSSSRVEEIFLNNTGSEITASNDSIVEMDLVRFATANFSATAKDIRARNVFNPPPDPEDLRNISQWINITNNSRSSWLSEPGFKYRPVNDTNINPTTIYKYDINKTSANLTGENITTLKNIQKRILFHPGNITNFSVIVPYGIDLRTQQGGEDEPGGEEGSGPTQGPGGGSGSGGGSGGGGGGGTGSGGGGGTQGPFTGEQPEPSPSPEAIELQLNVTETPVTMQQGESREIDFKLENVGDVAAEDVVVEANVRTGWQSSRREIETLAPGQETEETFLTTVYENEIPGRYTIPVFARHQPTNSSVDVDFLTVRVEPRQEISSVSVVESPSFLELTENSRESVAFFVENNGDTPLNNVTLGVRNAEECVSGISGSHVLPVGERESLSYSIRSNRGENTCNAVFVFREGDTVLGFAPVQIDIVAAGAISRVLQLSYLHLILILWTLLAIYWRWFR